MPYVSPEEYSNMQKQLMDREELIEVIKGLLRHLEDNEVMRPHQSKWITRAKQALNQDGGA